MGIRVERLAKTFKDFQLGPLSFECSDRLILGLVGQNGAGKTTLLRSVYGLYRQRDATIHIGGCPYDGTSALAKQRIVYQPEANNLPLFLTAHSLGTLLNRFDAKWSPEEYERLLAVFEVPVRKKVRALSTGTRRKLSIAAALAACPDVLLLDEPTSNTDPISRDCVLRELDEYRSRHPVAILFSSHILHDVRQIADRVLILNRGKVGYYGELLSADHGGRFEDPFLQYMR